jgi:hypothetical protein
MMKFLPPSNSVKYYNVISGQRTHHFDNTQPDQGIDRKDSMRSSRHLLLLSFSLVMLGCQREAVKKSSVTLQMPKAEKLSALSSWPSDRKACFGVNVSAIDIKPNVSSCSPDTGITGGYVEAGATLEIPVPLGKSRKFDLYLYLQPVGQNNPCPTMGLNLAGANLINTYLIGTATADISQDTAVAIDASFPGLSQNIAAANSMPSSCTAGSTPAQSDPNFHVNSGSGIATGSGYILKGKIGASVSGQTLTGTGYKLKVKGVQ